MIEKSDFLQSGERIPVLRRYIFKCRQNSTSPSGTASNRPPRRKRLLQLKWLLTVRGEGEGVEGVEGVG